MEKKIDIAKLLKGCPAGTPLYSPIFGNVALVKVWDDPRESGGPEENPIEIRLTRDGMVTNDYFASDGRYDCGIPNGECMLFPSKDNRSWEGWTPPEATVAPVTFRVTVQYTAEITTYNMPDEVLNAMIQQGKDSIELDEISTLADYIVETIKQEDACSSSAWLSLLQSGDNDWIE